ncbi:MAG: hypothetical protein K8R87_13875 [Verrucomicrobia bacterium]|nr:hypothetical protein [Verrucomicrobiota bacterium]
MAEMMAVGKFRVKSDKKEPAQKAITKGLSDRSLAAIDKLKAALARPGAAIN